MGRRLGMPKTSIKKLRMGFGCSVHPEIHTELTIHSVLRRSRKSPTQFCLTSFPKSSKHWIISSLKENIMATPWQANYIFIFELEKFVPQEINYVCCVFIWVSYSLNCMTSAMLKHELFQTGLCGKLLHASKGWGSSRGTRPGSFWHLLFYVYHEASSMDSK